MTSSAPSSPTVLMVPGLGNSGPGHWQSLWENNRNDCCRAELGNWDTPGKGDWVDRLDKAIARMSGPVVLVAHSLGCHAVAWWAATGATARTGKVIGALLVAPPDVDDDPAIPAIAGFGPTPKNRLPFPSVLAASRNDPYIRFEQARMLADRWGSAFEDVGVAGHINAASGLGSWPFGQALLIKLIDAVQSKPAE